MERSTSRARTPRRLRKPGPDVLAGDHSSAAAGPQETLRDAIEDGRARLMTAEALLHCVLLAMDEDDGRGAAGPDYQTLIALGRDLIKESIDQLDSVRLKPMLSKLRARGRDEVKEESGEYLH